MTFPTSNAFCHYVKIVATSVALAGASTPSVKAEPVTGGAEAQEHNDEAPPSALPNAVQRAPCDVAEAMTAAKQKTAEEARKFAASKRPELDDAQNRAERGSNRISKGDEHSWEGGGSRQEFSLDLPQFTLRYATKSFDFPQTAWKETRTRFGRFESCWWKTKLPFGGKIKTKGTCWRESDIVWKVPQFWVGRVEVRVPDAVESKMKTVRFSYDLPTVTVRDNRDELDKANTSVNRINAELEQGTAGIKSRNVEDARKQITAILDRAEAEALAEFDKARANDLAPFQAQRDDLTRSRDAARGQLAQANRQGEADAAFAPAFKLIDQAEAGFIAATREARERIVKEMTALREAHLSQGGLALACKPVGG